MSLRIFRVKLHLFQSEHGYIEFADRPLILYRVLMAVISYFDLGLPQMGYRPLLNFVHEFRSHLGLGTIFFGLR